jgi:hypothetical protein
MYEKVELFAVTVDHIVSDHAIYQQPILNSDQLELHQ